MSKRQLMRIAAVSALAVTALLLYIHGKDVPVISVRHNGDYAGTKHSRRESIFAEKTSAGNDYTAGANVNATPSGSAKHNSSAKAEDNYSKLPILDLWEGLPDSKGIKSRKRLLRRASKYPLVLVEERLSVESGGDEILLRQLAMVGDHVMVHLLPGYDESELRTLAKRNGFTIRKKMKVPGCFLVSVEPATVESVAKLTNVLTKSEFIKTAEPDYIETITDTTPNDTEYSKLWGMGKIGMPKVWDMTTGSDESVVAVFDTGTDLVHEDLTNNLWHNPAEIAGNGIDDDDNGYIDDVYGWDFYAEDNDPSDVYGHGSHVAGTIGAAGNNGIGVAGVNWNIKIMTIKFFGRNADGTLEGFASDAADGMYYVITQKIRGIHVRVTNHSWGGPGFSYIMRDVMDIAGGQGIMHMVAAGNNGNLDNDTDPQYPASYTLSNIVAVANTTSTDGLNSSSHYGATSVDLGAPGTGIYSIRRNGGYTYMTGTSMASPHTAGVAALMFAYMPDLTWPQVRQAILDGTDPLPSLAGKCVTGGRLNAYEALKEVGPFIEHIPLDNTTDTASDYIVEAFIKPSVPLIATNNVLVLWNTTGDTNTFSTNIMQYVTNDLFRGSIPAQPLGSVIHYMIKAVTKTGRTATDPANAPVSLHSFNVTEPIDMMVYGDPDEFGTVTPDYGDGTEPGGSTVTASAVLYAEETPEHRYRCSGWLGGGNVPSTGTSNSVSFTILRTSAILWQWQSQYSLAQTSLVTDVVNAATWWDENSAATTLTAPATAVMNGTNYAFICWNVDGTRFPGATNVAVNPAAGLTMDAAHQAEAVYLPENLDSEPDGLPDWWEMFYFADLNSGATNDPDGDGYSNLAEFEDLSNPRDAASIPCGPVIEHTPLADPMAELSPWRVSAVITDSVGVASAQLYRQHNGGTWTQVSMTAGNGNSYSADIPSPHSVGDSYSYYMQAVDNAGNTNRTPEYSFHVEYPLIATDPQSISLMLVSPTSTVVSLIITNSGNALLNWQLQTNYNDSISADEGEWTHSGVNDLWHISTQETHSAPYAWYCGDGSAETYYNSTDAGLVTPAVVLGNNPSFSFMQWFRSEYDGRAGMEDYFWDGGVVDISTNNGTSFTRIAPVGGYPYKITPNGDSPFPADTPCLAGTGGWEKVSFNLQEFAGKSVKVRFRFGSDKYTVERGWFIDDIRFDWNSDWLSISSVSGSVAAETSVNIPLTIDSGQLQIGDYYDSISLISNDPTTPILTVPVTLFVVMDSDKVHIKADDNAPNGFIISWLADASHSYSLVTSTNLISDTWNGIPGYTNMPGINGIMSYTGTVDSVSSKFYKVEETPL